MHCIRVMMRANLKRLNIRNELASYPAGKYRLLQVQAQRKQGNKREHLERGGCTGTSDLINKSVKERRLFDGI